MKTNYAHWPQTGRKFLACLSAAIFSLTSAQAQTPTIILNNDPTATGQCMGYQAYLPPAHFTLQNGTATKWVVSELLAVSNVSTGPYTFGCGTTFLAYNLNTPYTTTTANYYGPLTIYALNNSNCVIAQKTITIYPMDIQVTGSVSGPSSFYQTGTFTMGGNAWVNGSPYYTWAIGYGAEGYDITGGQGTSHVTITPKSWASMTSNVVVYGYFQPNGSPCGGASGYNPWDRISAQRVPYVSYDNSQGSTLCSGHQLHVNIWDTSASNYPGAPANANLYKHFTYQWKLNGSAISGATTKDYTPSGTGSYTCDVTQYDWSGSAWGSTGTKTSNAVSITAEAAHTINLFYSSYSLMGHPTAYTCQPVTITTSASGNEKNYSLHIYKNTSMQSIIVYNGPTVNGAPPASFNLLDYISPFISGGLDGWYSVTLDANNGCDDYYAYGDITLYTPPTAVAGFTINGSTASVDTTYNCDSIRFKSTTTGTATAYQLEVLNSSGGNIYSTGKKYGALPTAVFDLRNLCGITNTTNCNYLASHTGTYQVRYTTYDSCVANAKTITLYIPSPTAASAAFTVNDSSIADTISLYNCKPISFKTHHGGAIRYSLDISQFGGPIYSSGVINATPKDSLDLRKLCGMINSNPGCDYLDTPYSHIGVYNIRYTVFNGCVADTAYAVINMKTAPSSSLSIQTNARRKNNQSVPHFPASVSASAPDTVGTGSTTFILNASSSIPANICQYAYSLERYTGGGWDTTGMGGIDTSLSDCTSITPVTETISINDLGPYDPITGDAFFTSSTNAPNNSIWRMKVDLTNDCGTTSYYAVFVINRLNFKRNMEESIDDLKPTDVRFAPVPFKNDVSAMIMLPETAKVTMKIFTVDGRVVDEMKEMEMQAGQNFQSFQTATWASGVYFYQCTVGKEVFTGKIVKE